jgi:hypothetical protein
MPDASLFPWGRASLQLFPLVGTAIFAVFLMFPTDG